MNESGKVWMKVNAGDAGDCRWAQMGISDIKWLKVVISG